MFLAPPLLSLLLALAPPAQALPPPPVTTADPTLVCGNYRSLPEVYGYCVYHNLPGGIQQAEAVVWCTKAQTWEAECRHAWVADQIFRGAATPLEALLEVCGEDPNCRLDALDFRASADVLEQLQRCQTHGGAHAEDCAVHATQRWWYTTPTPAELQRVARNARAYNERIGFFLGAAVACDAAITCPEGPRTESYCRGWAEEFAKNPQRCPSHGAPGQGTGTTESQLGAPRQDQAPVSPVNPVGPYKGLRTQPSAP
jgi:hypothetical protein